MFFVLEISLRGNTSDMTSSTCRLIIDARERQVTRHSVEFADTNIEIKQITIGDYAIVTPTDKILAVIERKSYEDFAASLKDGRHNNKEKMLALRLATGCSVILLLEGPAFPAPASTFSNFPYRVIESAVFHMQVRDNIQVIRTPDTLGSAQMLARFVRSMDTLWAKFPVDSMLESRVDAPRITAAKIANAVDDGIAAAKTVTADSPHPITGGTESEDTTDTHVEESADISTDTTPSQVDLLTVRLEHSTREIARRMWSKFRGISVDSADEFLTRWSIADLVAGAVDGPVESMKMATGKKISKRVVAAVRDRDRALEAKMLAEVPGISIGTARLLLERETLHQLITGGAEKLADHVVTKNGYKLGPSKSARVMECLTYKHTPGNATH
jgi:ERCC4-type nuclease